MEEKKNVNEEIENEAVEVTALDDNDLEEVAGGPVIIFDGGGG